MIVIGHGLTANTACHCARSGISAHWHDLVAGCPREPVAARTPCAHGRYSFCGMCWGAACSWYRGKGCVCTEDDPRERALIAAAESADERPVSGPERRTSRAQFDAYLERQFAAIKAINSTKGRDYTAQEDALANLRDRPEVGLTGGQVLWVYLDKHLRAIQRYILEGQVESEPIEGRIHDAVLYLLLLGALVEEQGEHRGAAVERDGAS